MTGTWGVIGATLVGQGASVEPTKLVDGPSSGTSVAAGGTAHTKGSWTEIIASTAGAADMISLIVSGLANSATDTAALLDIGTGAAASEVVLVPDIACGGAAGMTNTGGAWQINIPIAVASGTRISARMQCAVASRTATIYITLFSGGAITGTTTAVSLGTSTGTSTGVEVGTAWTEIVASTAATYTCLVAVPSLSTTSAATAVSTPVVIGTGAASSEVEVAQLPTYTNFLEDIRCGDRLLGWGDVCILPGVPAGTRLVAKRATDACDVSFIGIT